MPMTYPLPAEARWPFVMAVTPGVGAEVLPDPLLAMAAAGWPVLHVRVFGTCAVGVPTAEWPSNPTAARAAVAAAWPRLWAAQSVAEGRAFACVVPRAWRGTDGVEVSLPTLAWELLARTVGAPDVLLLCGEASAIDGVNPVLLGQIMGIPSVHRFTCLTSRLGGINQTPHRVRVLSAQPWSAEGLVVVDGSDADRLALRLARACPATHFAVAQRAPPPPPAPPNLHAVPAEHLDAVATEAWAVAVAPGRGASDPGRWPPGTVLLGGSAAGAWPCDTLDDYIRAVAWARLAYARRGGAPTSAPAPALLRALEQLVGTSCGGRGCDGPPLYRTPATATPTNRK
jgi:hypothetical protein